MELYHGRLDKKPNALAIRIRYVAQRPADHDVHLFLLGQEGNLPGCFRAACLAGPVAVTLSRRERPSVCLSVCLSVSVCVSVCVSVYLFVCLSVLIPGALVERKIHRQS